MTDFQKLRGFDDIPLTKIKGRKITSFSTSLKGRRVLQAVIATVTADSAWFSIDAGD